MKTKNTLNCSCSYGGPKKSKLRVYTTQFNIICKLNFVAINSKQNFFYENQKYLELFLLIGRHEEVKV
jgi:hypothetical protein